MGISIILPTYNEAENIYDLIGEIIFYIQEHVEKPFEIIVVDDDSPDGTWEVVERRFKEDGRVRVVRRIGERGLTSAIRKGIEESKGNIVAWMDCDFSMPPHRLAELINKIYDGLDICVGSRFVRGGKDLRGPTDSWTAVILSRIMNYCISLALGSGFKDYTSGFVAAKKDVFDDIELRGDYGEYFIDFIYRARKNGYRIVELPYYCLPRRAGESKTGSNLREYFQKGWKYVIFTFRLRLKGEDGNDRPEKS